MNVFVLICGLMSLVFTWSAPAAEAPELTPLECQKLFLKEVVSLEDRLLPWEHLGDVTSSYTVVSLLVRIDIRGKISVPMMHLGLRPDAIDMPQTLSIIHDGAVYAILRGYSPALMAAAEELDRRYGAARLSFQIVGAPPQEDDFIYLPVPTNSISAQAPDVSQRVGEFKDVMLVDYESGSVAVATERLNKFPAKAVAKFQIKWLPEGTSVAELLKHSGTLHAVKLESSTLLTHAAHQHLKAYEARPLDPRLLKLYRHVPFLSSERKAHFAELIQHVDPHSAWSIAFFLRRLLHEEEIEHLHAFEVLWSAWQDLAPHRSTTAIWRDVMATFGPQPGTLRDVEMGSNEGKARLIAAWKIMIEDARYAYAHPDHPPYDYSEPEHDGLSILLHLENRFGNKLSPQALFDRLYAEDLAIAAPDFNFPEETRNDAIIRPEAESQTAVVRAYEAYERKKNLKTPGRTEVPESHSWIIELGPTPAGRDLLKALNEDYGQSVKVHGVLIKAIDHVWEKYLPGQQRKERKGFDVMRDSDGKHVYNGTSRATARVLDIWREFYEAFVARYAPELSQATAADFSRSADNKAPQKSEATSKSGLPNESDAVATEDAWITKLGPSPSGRELLAELNKQFGRNVRNPGVLAPAFDHIWTTHLPGHQRRERIGMDVMRPSDGNNTYSELSRATARTLDHWREFYDAFVARKAPAPPPTDEAEMPPESEGIGEPLLSREQSPPASLGRVDVIEASNWIEALGLEPSRDKLVQALIEHTGLTKSLWSLKRSFEKLYAGLGQSLPPAFDVLKSDGAMVIYGSTPTTDRRLFDAWRAFWTAFVAERAKTHQSNAKASERGDEDFFRDARARLKTTSAPSFADLVPPEQIKTNDELATVLTALAHDVGVGDLTQPGAIRELCIALYVKLFPRSPADSIIPIAGTFAFRPDEFALLQPGGPVDRETPAFVLYSTYHGARRLRDIRGPDGFSFEKLPDPKTITTPLELRSLLSDLNRELRTGNLKESGSYDRFFAALFARAYPKWSVDKIRYLVSRYKFRSTEYRAVKMLTVLDPDERALRAYRDFYQAYRAPASSTTPPPAPPDAPKPPAAAAANPVSIMIGELAKLFQTTPEALMAGDGNRNLTWHLNDDFKPLFSLSVALLRSALERPESEASVAIVNRWQKDKDAIAEDQLSQAREASSLTLIEPYRVREFANLLAVRYDAQKTRDTFRKVWKKYLPQVSESDLTALFERLKLQSNDLAEAARVGQVHPSVFRRLRGVWTELVAQLREHHQLIAPPAMDLPHPNQVDDARRLVETLAQNISFSIPSSGEPIVDVFKALFADLNLGPQDIQPESIIRSRVMPDDLARVSQTPPDGPASRRILGLYRIYFERITGDVEASASGKNKPPLDLSLPLENNVLGTLLRGDMMRVLEAYPTTVAWSAEAGLARNLERIVQRFVDHPRFELAMEELKQIEFGARDYGLIQHNDRTAIVRLRRAWRVLQLLLEPKELREPIDTNSVRRMGKLLDAVIVPDPVRQDPR